MWLAALVLAGLIVAVIARGVIDQGEVNSQSVVGAICIYLRTGHVLLRSPTGRRPSSDRATSSPRERTAPRRSGSTSATSRWPRSATATTARPETSDAHWPFSKGCSASCTWSRSSPCLSADWPADGALRREHRAQPSVTGADPYSARAGSAQPDSGCHAGCLQPKALDHRRGRDSRGRRRGRSPRSGRRRGRTMSATSRTTSSIAFATASASRNFASPRRL